MIPTWKHKEVHLRGLKKPVFKIITKELVDVLSREINELWKGEQMDDKIRFPGSQPVSIEKRNFNQLIQEPYVVCAKLDGERYFLYITEIPYNLECPKETTKICFLVNRNLDFFIVVQQFTDISYTKKTLLDGELIENDFIVHDSIIIAGEIVKDKNWETRWRTANMFITTQCTNIPRNTFMIYLKEFFFFKQIETLIKKMKENKYKTDGIIFYPMNDPIKFRTQINFFKWKPPGHHTIDFKIKITEKKVIHLMTWGHGKEITFEKMNISKFKDILTPKEGQVIEFKGRKGNFVPIKVRNDKPVGNNLYTVKKTLLNIAENITEEDLINLSRSF
jgi:mRNA-capping enzyme